MSTTNPQPQWLPFDHEKPPKGLCWFADISAQRLFLGTYLMMDFGKVITKVRYDTVYTHADFMRSKPSSLRYIPIPEPTSPQP